MPLAPPAGARAEPTAEAAGWIEQAFIPANEAAAGGGDQSMGAAPGHHPVGPDDFPNVSRESVNSLVVSRTGPGTCLVARDGIPLAHYHKLHVGVDGGRERIVTAGYVTAGDVADDGLLDRLGKGHQGTYGNTLAEVVADPENGTAASYGQLQVADAPQGGCAVSILLRQKGWERLALPRSRLTYDPEQDAFVCPEGQRLACQCWSATAGTRGGVIYRSPPSACRERPYKLLCCGQAEVGTITHAVDEDVREHARALVATGHPMTSIRSRKTWGESAMAELKERYACRCPRRPAPDPPSSGCPRGPAPALRQHQRRSLARRRPADDFGNSPAGSI